MEFFIHNGIPYRIAVCRCILGNLRDDPSTVESSDATYDYTNLTGAHPRSNKHGVNGPHDSTGQKITITAMTPWYGYPSKPEEGELIAMARGGVGSNGTTEPVFPSIQITLRPLRTELNYRYTGNANVSGDENGKLDTNLFYGIDQVEEDYNAHQTNAANAKLTYGERGGPKSFSATTYYHSEDVSDGGSVESLQVWEPDVKLFPNLSTEEPYGFGHNETWDSRYRYPSNITEFGDIDYSFWTGQNNQTLVFTPHSQVGSDDNPIYPPDGDFYGATVRGIAPIIKGWYWDGGQGSFPAGMTDERDIFNHSSLKIYKYIRTRYSFSFNASDENRNGSYYVLDNNPMNVHSNWNGNFFDTYRDTYPFPYVNQYNEFNCSAWWRMEINTELCEWNYDKKLKKGWKIKGTVLFAFRGLDTKERVGSASIGGTLGGTSTYLFWYGSNRGIWPGRAYQTLKKQTNPQDTTPYVFQEDTAYEGGGMPFEVEVTEVNAKGRPVAFWDFPIGGSMPVLNEDGTVKEIIPCGVAPENSIVYISDFFITSIEPPSAPASGVA